MLVAEAVGRVGGAVVGRGETEVAGIIGLTAGGVGWLDAEGTLIGGTGVAAVGVAVPMVDERGSDFPVWVKVNMYGGVVAVCAARLVKGCSVTVFGSLMNRKRSSGERAVEIKGREVIFHSSSVRKEDNG
jgi:single-stranded DNA-binding protein